jgi:hypothetical protein
MNRGITGGEATNHGQRKNDSNRQGEPPPTGAAHSSGGLVEAVPLGAARRGPRPFSRVAIGTPKYVLNDPPSWQESCPEIVGELLQSAANGSTKLKPS